MPLRVSVPLTNCKARVTVDCLNQFFTLVTHNPVWIILGCSFWIQGNHLKPSEVSLTDFHIFRADVINVWHTVLVKVIFASISTSITCRTKVVSLFWAIRHWWLFASVASSLTTWEVKTLLRSSDCPGTADKPYRRPKCPFCSSLILLSIWSQFNMWSFYSLLPRNTNISADYLFTWKFFQTLNSIKKTTTNSWKILLKCYYDTGHLTIRIHLIWVGNQSAVIFVIRNTIIVIIMVTGITFSILVMISLIGIGHIRAIIKIILMTIFIYILVVITLITYKVRVSIFLKKKIKGKIKNILKATWSIWIMSLNS